MASGEPLPGTETAEGSELHPNAVEQEYNEAGGKRVKGEARKTAFNPAKPPTEAPGGGG